MQTKDPSRAVFIEDDANDSCGDGCCGKDSPEPEPVTETKAEVETPMTTIEVLDEPKKRKKSIKSPLFKRKKKSLDGRTYGSVGDDDYKAIDVYLDDDDKNLDENVVVTTKLRVANLCCHKEVALLKSTLEKECRGIQSINVDQVGRRAVVTHDLLACPKSELVGVLNGVQLGVSIQEERRDSLESDAQGMRKSVLFHVVMTLACLVLLGALLVQSLSGPGDTLWMIVLALVIIVFGGFPILHRAVVALFFQRRIDIHVLMLIAVVGALVLRQWVESCVIVFACELAHTIQLVSQYRIQLLMSGLFLEMDVPSRVSMKDGTMRDIEDVGVGDILAIRPGDRVPLDGEVVKGSAAFDESAITGEAQPQNKTKGDKLLSGTLSTNGYVEMRVVTTSDQSTIHRLRDLVDEACASSGKSKVQQDIDKVVRYYTPGIIVLAFLVGAIGLLAEYIREKGVSRDRAINWVTRALVVLISGCPCSLVMASPIVLLSGIASCATQKILVKHSKFLEQFRNVTSVVFDKTGTLTEGRFRMTGMIWKTEDGSFELGEIYEEGSVNNSEKNPYLTKVVAVEAKSNHPLAPAIVGQYLGCVTSRVMEFGANVGLPDVKEFKVHEGLGVSAMVDGTKVEIGNEAFMGNTEELTQFITEAESQASTCVMAKIDDELVGAMAFSDQLREESASVVRTLQQRCLVQCTLITGDNRAVANFIARSCGMEHDVHAEFRPHQKLQWISNHQKDRQQVVCMVGDGINDGPALSMANVGIAMGASGTGLAVDSADVVLLNDDLNSIPILYDLSRFCFTLLVENLMIAIIPKLIVVVAAISGFYLEKLLWVAVLVDALSLLLVVTNGTRAYACQGGTC